MNDDARFTVDAATLEIYLALRDEAVRHAVRAGERAFPEFFARPGRRDHESYADDIGLHIDFLRPTLETGDLSPFSAYLAWLAQVIGKRGIPQASLTQALDDLAEFFDARLGDAARPIVTALAAGRRTVSGAGDAPAPAYDRPCPLPWEESAAFTAAALRGQRQEAATLFEHAVNRARSLTQAAEHVIQPALYDIGRQWQENRVSVAQEHLAAAVAQTLMAQAMGRARAAPDNGRRALFACTTGNHHSIGLRMVADAFELDGWTTDYLGANTPLPDLIDQVRETRPDLVGLSISLPQHLRPLKDAIDALHAAFGDDCPQITVGGLVFNQFPRLAESLGGHLLGSDASSTLAAVRQHFGVEPA